jgi:hypothetical protein
MRVELFGIIVVVGIIDDYMHDKMKLLSGKVDLDKFVDMRFAKESGAI